MHGQQNIKICHIHCQIFVVVFIQIVAFSCVSALCGAETRKTNHLKASYYFYQMNEGFFQSGKSAGT